MTDYLKQAELALAAYGQLYSGISGESFISALQEAGMSPTQAARFARDWRVIDQYNASSGLSATVFERDDQTYLAIRGTELTDPGDIAANIDIASGVNPLQIPQYQNLRTRVTEWLAAGALRSGFTVAGHSLGGFLATALTVEFAQQVGHAYLYNAPGFGGAQSRDVGLTPDASLISNIKSAVPFSPIAGLGRQVQPVITIAAENQFSPDIPNPPVSFNHDQSILTDALAVAALYAELNPDLSIAQTNWLLQAASQENNRTLEDALDALRKTLLGPQITATPTEDRETFYANLYALSGNSAYQSLLGGGNLRILQNSSPAELAAGAGGDFGLLVALYHLLPVAVAGAGDRLCAAHADLYAQWLADQAAEPEDRTFTENWLTDRARMLEARIAVNTTDSNLASPGYFRDIPTNTVLGGNLFGVARRTIFGAEGGDNIEGGFNEDRLYGMAGADSIDGGMSADYLEGGAGADRLGGDSGADTLNGGAGEDTLVGGSGNDSLKGGAEADTLYGDAELENDTASGGEDTLEGGGADDRLFGGAGRDDLLGGAGADTLRGGAGAADYLVGGEGNDTYLYMNSDQADLLWDEDGAGRIEYERITLDGGTRPRGRSRNRWTSADGRFTYETDADPGRGPVTLTVRSAAGGRLTVLNFSNDQLGIHLGDAPNTPGTARNGAPPPAPPINPGSQNRLDPLLIDLTGQGIATVGLDAQLHFDQDGDGFAEASGWAAAGAGLLMRDANANGVLDDGRELFGDATVLAGGQMAANGFQALSQYDRNRDGVIDANDAIWQELRVAVWEQNPRGGALAGDPQDATNLRTLDELGIAAIGLDSTLVNAGEANGNTRTRTGSLTLADGGTREVAEYRFVRDNAETRLLGWREVPEAIAVLPELTLGGVQMELAQALARDAEEGWQGRPPGSLRARLEAFLDETDIASAYARFEELLFAWTGAEAIAEGQSTNELDARHAHVLERAYGRSFRNPDAEQAAAWQTAYGRLAEWAYAQLLSQAQLAPLFEAIDWEDSAVTGAPFGNLARAEALLEAELAADPQRGRALANAFGRSLRGLGLTRETTYFALRERFTENGEAGLAFEFDAVGKPLQSAAEGRLWGDMRMLSDFTQAVQAPAGTPLYGNGGDDVLYGAADGVRLVGGAGDNVLSGGAGGETLWAHEGDDVLDGGPGADRLLGWAGNDVYVFRPGGGADAIEEGGGVDMVFFGGGLTRADLTAARLPGGGYELRIAGGADVLTLPASFGFRGDGRIERFLFSDGTLCRLGDLFAPSEGDDLLLYDYEAGDDRVDALGGNDTAIGGAGADALGGGAGDDLLDGGADGDLLEGGTGDDTLLGGEGDDILDGGAGDDLLAATEQDGSVRPDRYDLTGAGNGNDEYRFGFGDGRDTLADTDLRVGNLDTIALKAGVRPADVTLRAEGEDMILELSSGDALRVLRQYHWSGRHAVERILFADGTAWSGTALYEPTYYGTGGNDAVNSATGRNARLVGLEGDDRLSGEGGNDWLDGGEGRDVLTGGGGNDTCDGGAGDDALTEADADVRDASGADVFLFGRGDGHDALVSRRIVGHPWWYSAPRGQAGPPQEFDDVVRFNAGVNPEDIGVTGVRTPGEGANRSADVLVDIAGDEAASLRIESFLGGYRDGFGYTTTVRRFEFADGTVWNYEDIASRLAWRGTPGDDGIGGSEHDDRIHGYAGDDTIRGGFGDDRIEAGEGDDSIDGGGGSDAIDAGAGDDRIDPGDGEDSIDGGAGDDLVSSHYSPWLAAGGSPYAVQRQGDLTLLFGRGDGRDTVEITNQRAGSDDVIRLKPGVAPQDVALRREGDDLVLRLAGTEDSLTVRSWFCSATDAEGRVTDPFRIERILFEDGTQWGVDEMRARVLIGTDGEDILRGYAEGDDLLDGRAGNDLLRGDAGNDSYAFRTGDGRDEIADTAGADRVVFADRLSGEVAARRLGDDLVLEAGTDAVAVRGWFASSGEGVRAVRFADGEEWDAASLRERVLTGTPGEDAIEGYEGDDALDGLGGADALAGGAGGDTYVHRRGEGRDTIRETAGADTLLLPDLRPDEVTLRGRGMDLLVTVNAAPGEGETDAVRIVDWFARDAARVERIVFADGSAFDEAAIRQAASLVTDSDDELLGTPGDDLLDGGGGNDTVSGLEGDDVIRGGAGNDVLYGGTGNNEFRIGRGDGFDEITLDPGRFRRFWEYLDEALDELEQLGWSGSEEPFHSDYLAGQGEGLLSLPEEIRAPLLALETDTAPDEARAALDALVAWISGGDNLIVLDECIVPGDLSLQYSPPSREDDGEGGGDIVPPRLAVGFGGEEGFVLNLAVVQESDGDELELAPSLLRLRFSDGTEWTLDGLLGRAEEAIVGHRQVTEQAEFLRGSAGRDVIVVTAENGDRVDARGQNDVVDSGDEADVVSGGSGDDTLRGGSGWDVIAGGAGADLIEGGPGSDVYAYNCGDGADRIDNRPGLLDGDRDALSFGGGIRPEDVTAYVDGEGRLILLGGAEGDSLTLAWFDPAAGFAESEEDGVALAQFIAADGSVRIFDLAGLVHARQGELLAADAAHPFAIFAGAEDHDITESCYEEEFQPGGEAAVAYATRGDLFIQPSSITTFAGDDSISGGEGDDQIWANEGNDLIEAGAGNDFVDAGPGDDSAAGGQGNDYITAGPGNDSATGGDGSDGFQPGEGDDVMDGGNGNDYFFAGAGNDSAIGGAGNDYYDVSRRFGSLFIDDLAQPGAGNVVSFYEVAPGELSLSAGNGWLVMRLADGGEIHMANFNPADPYATQAVEEYQFWDADDEDLPGVQLAYADLLRMGLVLPGSEAADVLVGADGADSVSGGGGDDLVAGGAGNDLLEGGAGADTYVFNAGDGEDTLVDAGTPSESNVLRFGPGIDATRLLARMEAGELLLRYGDAGDLIRMPGYAASGDPAGVLQFNGGATLAFSELVARGLDIRGTPGSDALGGGAGADSIAGGVGDDVLAGGAGGDSYRLAAGGGLDIISDAAEAAQENTLILEHADVRSLADLRLAFDRSAGTLSIVSRASGEGAVLGGFDPDDPLGSRAVDRIVLAATGESFTFAQLLEAGIEIEGTAGHDEMEGTAMRDILRGLDGDDLIAGGGGGDLIEGGDGDDAYVFERGDGVLTIREAVSRTPGNTVVFGEGIAVGDIRNTLRFIAPDAAAGTPGWLRIGIGSLDAAGDEIRIEGFDPADAEIGEHGVEYFLFADGTLLSYRDLVLNTFVVQGDEYDDALSGTSVQDRLYGYEGSDALRAGAGNDALTGGAGEDVLEGGAGRDLYAFSRGDGADLIVEAGAADEGGILAFGEGIAPADLAWRREGEGLLVEYGAGDAVRIQDWTRQQAALWQLRFADGTSMTAAQLLNAAPQAVQPLAAQAAAEDAPLAYAVPADAFVDPEGGALEYGATLADGRALPSWLGFDPSARTFSGTPENLDVGSYTIRVDAADAFGASAAQQFELTVANTNDAPVLTQPLADQAAMQGQPFTYAMPAGAFADIDAGDVLTYAATLADGSALPAWLTFEAATGSFSGTPGNGDVGAIDVRVGATDLAGASASAGFTLAVANVNDAPTLVQPLADQSATQGQPFAYSVPAGAFADIDAGDVLAYGATLSDGGALPAWLTFEAATQSFAGTPDAVADLEIRLTATDAGGLAADDLFRLSVAPVAEGRSITGSGADEVLTGGAGNDTLDGGGGRDLLEGAGGDDTLRFAADGRWRHGNRAVHSGSPGIAGMRERQSLDGLKRSLAVFDGGEGLDTLAATEGPDALILDDDLCGAAREGARITGIELIEAGGGADVVDLTSRRYALGDVAIRGGAGGDVLWSSAGNDLVDGGRGNDRIAGGAGAEFIVGAAGHDAIDTGAGAAVVAFNRGDGHDGVRLGAGPATLSLGGGIGYEDLRLRRSGADLVLETGEGERLALEGWYRRGATRPTGLTLQVIAEAMADFAPGGADPLRDERVETFDLAGLAQACDAARAAHPGLTRWALADALAQFHLGGSDTEALGGELAWQYGRNGTLSGIGLGAALEVLGDARFGLQAQALGNGGPQDGGPRLG